MNEPRVYKNSPATLMVVIVFFIIILASITFTAVFDLTITMLIGAFGVLVFLIIFLSVSSKAILSDDEVTSQNILSSKTLRWTEITRVSGTGNGIKLHNEDTTVSINPRLPGYEEIIEIIGQKRADLFSAQEFSEMRRGLGSYFGFFIIGVLFVGIIGAFFFLSDFSSESFLSLAFTLIFLLVFLWMFLSSPQSLTIEDRNLRVKYLVSEKNVSTEEVAGIYFAHTRTRRGGKQYYVSIRLRNGKDIRVSGLNIGLPVAYLVLKNWHKKYIN